MVRTVLLVGLVLALAWCYGCESSKPKKRSWVHYAGGAVDVDVSDGSAKVRVRRKGGKDVDVDVSWP